MTPFRDQKVKVTRQINAVNENRPYLLPCKLTFDLSTLDLLTLKVVSESRVTWATSVPILVFLGLSVLKLGPDVRNRQTSDAHRRLMPPTLGAGA